MYKPVTLSKRTAKALIGRMAPKASITQEKGFFGAVIFRAVTGDGGLEITCENDWYDRNGRIRLTISDGENRIVHYYHPDTLNRDYTVEEAEKERLGMESRINWVERVGREMAHSLVDIYWEG